MDYLLNLIYLIGSLLLLLYVFPKKKKGWAKNVLIASITSLLMGVGAFLSICYLNHSPESMWWAVQVEWIAKGLGLAGLFVLALTRNLRPKEGESDQNQQP